jgi:plastocyanin
MDLDGSIFWYFGGALVLAALVISFIGIRGKASFPPSGPAMWGVTAVFGVLVAGACAYGVANAAEEKEHRDHELAAEEAEAEEAVAEEPPASEQTAPSAPEGGQPPGSVTESEEANLGNQELALTSPEDGSLVFDPDGLDAQPGAVTLAYNNPSPVPHNVALEDEGGQLVVESDTISDASVSVNAELVPGEYIYFCSVPGHREGGMEGTLTVDADSATAE